MKINNTISKIKNGIKKYYDELEAKQKIILLTIVVIILFTIVNLFSIDRNKLVDYKNYDSSMEYITMNDLTDNNLYVTLSSISKDFLEKSDKYENGKKINIKEIYDTILNEEYSDYLSKNKFEKLYKECVNKADKIKTVNGELLPENIVVDLNGNYMVKYSCTTNEEEITLFVGIQINTAYNKYYIWYLE